MKGYSGVSPNPFVSRFLDGTSSIKKESDGRKSATPVKSELASTPNGSGSSSDKKDVPELAIKSEGKS